MKLNRILKYGCIFYVGIFVLLGILSGVSLGGFVWLLGDVLLLGYLIYS